MKTNLDDVFAIGDVVEFPLFIANDTIVNIQHYQMAHQHGWSISAHYLYLCMFIHVNHEISWYRNREL